MYKRLAVFLGLAAWLSVESLLAVAAESGTAQAVLNRIGVTRGICVVLGDRECQLARALADRSELTLLVQLAADKDVAAAARAADAAGLYGTRIFVAKGTGEQIGLADNVADALIAARDAAGPVSKSEVLRVLRPDGKASILDTGEEMVKPFPEGVDDWPHHYHGADNNPQSRDRLARAPYLTQFIAEPRYAPAPQMCVAAAGRVFMAFGHVAWHQREESSMDTLMAVNGFNGTMLWKRPLTSGLMVDRSTMIATPTTLYLADDKSCKLLDTKTGELSGEITVPADLAGGTFWKWMALENGVLYALVGQQEAPDPEARWQSTRHGWPWTGISTGYNAAGYSWGFGNTLLAIDPKSKKVLWQHQEDPPIDSRSLCMKNGRIFFCSFGHYLGCLSAETGKERWRKTAEKDPEVFQAIGPYRPGHGWIVGWKSTVYLKCTDKALYCVGPQVEWLSAFSADDGRVLWKHPAKDLHIVIRDDGVYTIGAQNTVADTKKLDPLSGEVLAAYQTHRRACTRSTGTCDGILFRAQEGSGRFDLASGRMQWISAMRPSCHVGVVIADGHLYWLPWACDCNLQMFGVICCGPAGAFAFEEEATERQRLERPVGDTAGVAPFRQSPADWPTYRADNARSARTQAAIPEKVGLLWEFAGHAGAEPTSPVAAGGMVFCGGQDGIVRALDAQSGKVQWTAYTGGAVRYPPTIADGRALVGSGDGWVYALEAATGRVLWRFRAAPAERRIPIYGSLLSTWPVVGGVLVEKGTAYFAAGMNDFDGTHLYALDLASGKIRWQNHSSGHLDAVSKRGVACQGEMLLDGGRLYLAGGNAVSPGIFQATDGRCLNSPPTSMGTTATRGRELQLVGGRVAVVGQPLYSRPEMPVFDKSVEWSNPLVAAKNAELVCLNRPGANGPAWGLVARKPQGGPEIWTVPLPAMPVRWAVAVDARGRILVALRNGRLLCFGEKPDSTGD